jgi:hypothetical protein
MKPLRIYIAGPYSAKPSKFDADSRSHDAPRQTHQNVRKAVQVAIELMKKGHLVYVPHLGHYIQLEMSEEDMMAIPGYPEVWYEWDNAWLKQCNALFYVGQSFGADYELALAQQEGLQIFRSLDEVSEVTE